MLHTYYIPAHRKVYGSLKDEPELVAFLYATYMRFETGHTGRYDGVSHCHGSNDIVTLNNRIRIAIGHDGRGIDQNGDTGKVFDVVDGVLVEP